MEVKKDSKKESKKGKRIGIEYKKINLSGRWWKWEEREERLKHKEDSTGKRRKEERRRIVG
jgi:hypothetical protein